MSLIRVPKGTRDIWGEEIYLWHKGSGWSALKKADCSTPLSGGFSTTLITSKVLSMWFKS